MSRKRGFLSPLDAYVRAERQKAALAASFQAGLRRLHQRLSLHGVDALRQPGRVAVALRQSRREAARAFAAAPPDALIDVYRDILLRHGVTWITPGRRGFRQELRRFYRNYVTNFPLPEEQETLGGFRALWRASPREGGYEELGVSVCCPFTGRYLMGLNFTIQPQSNSVHFIYGFVNPGARGLGLSASMIALMRETGRSHIADHFSDHPQDRPAYYSPDGPLILFEKNILGDMSLTDILMDSAHIDIDRPPRRKQRLSASAMSQTLRDSLWHRRGGRILDYVYIQSSLDGVVRVPPAEREAVIAHLTGAAPSARAEAILTRALGSFVPGCLALNLCAFLPPETQAVPAAQIRRSNEIFQGISVVKDVPNLADDIYFQAHMASLSDRTREGKIGVRPITPYGTSRSFAEAEAETRRLLAGLDWAALQADRHRTYASWLQ